jgi:1-phosphofructokinase family hexose kinase
MSKKFLSVCLNPTIQNTLVFDRLEIDHVNRAKIFRTDASGKGINVTRVLSQSGADVMHLTHAGGPNRDWFLSLCAADGLDIRWVDSHSEVRICATAIDSGESTTTELVEEARQVSMETEAKALSLFDELIREVDVLIVSGTKAAGYSAAVIPSMVERASKRGVLSILDIKGADLVASLPFKPAVVKPNIHEFLASFPAPEGIVAVPSALRAYVRNYARSWRERYATELVVTRGSESIWFNENNEAAEEWVVPVKAVNNIGSGDSFTAGVALVLAAGGSLREAVRQGARLGALNAARLKPGSIVADAEDSAVVKMRDSQ